MLPDETRDALARKVEEYFGNPDKRLRGAAFRLQGDGYADTDILNILQAAYITGYDEGYTEGEESQWN